MHLLVLAILENITYVIFCANVARLLQYFNNLTIFSRNISTTLYKYFGAM